MANVLIREETMTAIADAIRNRNREERAYKPLEMVDGVKSITDQEDALMEGTCVNYYNDRITKLKADCFYSTSADYLDDPETIELPNVVQVGQNAFRNASNIRKIILPQVETFAGAYHCHGCKNLEEIYIPKATAIPNYFAQNCELLKTIVCPSVTSVGSSAFRMSGSSVYGKLEEIKMPLVKTIGEYGLYNQTSIKEIDFPLVESIGNYGLYGVKMKSVVMPLLQSVNTCSFYFCNALQYAEFTAVTKINSNAFYSCSKLLALVLNNETCVSLANTNALTGSAIANKFGYIYVPRALVDTYKTATNWTTYASQFRAIEDYPNLREEVENADIQYCMECGQQFILNGNEYYQSTEKLPDSIKDMQLVDEGYVCENCMEWYRTSDQSCINCGKVVDVDSDTALFDRRMHMWYCDGDCVAEYYGV